MADRMLDLMLKLDAARGISGYEEEVAEIMQAELAPLSDEHSRDPLGNHYFTKRGAKGAPVLMLCAHMDELGFLVQHIEDEGFLRLAPVGYHDDRMLTDQVLEVQGANGPVIGVVGTKPAHVVSEEERRKAIPLHEMFVDLGTASREETEALGVRVGDPITFVRTGMLLNGTRVFTGKAVDDRSGCAVMIETMRRLARARHLRHRRRRRERAGGARPARRGPRGVPRAARRGDRARRHAGGRHAGDRVPPAADQARRRPCDQVLRLGARGRRSARPCRAA